MFASRSPKNRFLPALPVLAPSWLAMVLSVFLSCANIETRGTTVREFKYPEICHVWGWSTDHQAANGNPPRRFGE